MKLKSLLALVLLLAASPAFAAYSFDVAANNVSNANTISISPTAGDVIVLFIETSSGGGTPTISVADNVGGDSWQVVLNNSTQGSYHFDIAYVLNCPSGITTITVTFNGNTPGNNTMRASAYSGMSSGTYIGLSTVNNQTSPGTGSNAITSSALNVTLQPALFMGLSADQSQNGGFTAGSSPLTFTLRGTLDNGMAMEDTRVTSTGNESANFTNATHGTDNFNTWAIAFSETSGASCTNSGITSAGAIAVPNGSSGSYRGKTGSFVTPDCSTVNYLRPTVGNFGTS